MVCDVVVRMTQPVAPSTTLDGSLWNIINRRMIDNDLADLLFLLLWFAVVVSEDMSRYVSLWTPHPPPPPPPRTHHYISMITESTRDVLQQLDVVPPLNSTANLPQCQHSKVAYFPDVIPVLSLWPEQERAGGASGQNANVHVQRGPHSTYANQED